MSKQIVTGRPQDTPMEEKFMEQLRGPKLQYINAESQLQVSIAAMPSDKSNQQQHQINLTEQQMLKIFKGFIQHISVDRLKILFRHWNQAFKSWQYKEIKDVETFPKYLFDDSTDLGYIIDCLLSSQEVTDNRQLIRSQELLFLQMLCLQQRNQMSEAVMKSIMNNFKYVTNLIAFGLEKMKTKIVDKEERMKQERVYNDQSQGESQTKKQTQKGKKIKKDKKKKNKKQSQQNSQQQSQKESNLSPQKQLAVKMANFISWAYYYILSK